MLSVLHVAQPTEAGVAAYVAAASADQCARGWKVTVACPDGGNLGADLAAMDISRLPWHARRSPGPATASEALRLRQIISRVRPDVLHLHSSKAGLAGRLAARGRLPTLFQPHGWSWLAVPDRMKRATLAWERAAAGWTTLFVCVGPGEVQRARECGLHGRYTVVPNGVDLRRFLPAGQADRQAARRRLGINPQTPLAACVGRVTRQKGQDLLITAWPTVLAHRADARLVIIGAGDLRQALKCQAPPSVEFQDPVRDVWPWYAASDVVVLPSRWEGLSLTLLEALASGRPVVASDISGIAEATPVGAGALVPPDDPAALAQQIVCRFDDPERARSEGLAGAKYAAAKADVRHTHDRLAAVSALLADRRL